MMDVLKSYFPLCWFKTHPLQLPESISFFKQNLIVYFVITFVTLSNMIPISEAFVLVLADIAFTLLLIALLLGLNQSLHNYIQIATGGIFCANVIAVFTIPVIAWLIVTHDWFSYAVLIAVMGWYLALITFIMKKVLAINTLASLVIALVYFIITHGTAYALTMAF